MREQMQTRLEMLRKELERGQVEHAFDLLAPQISPSAQAALYDVERFLALVL